MATILIYTRHALTDEQRSAIDVDSKEDKIVDCSDLAKEVIVSKEQAKEHVKKLLQRADHLVYIYGVISAPVRWALETMCFNSEFTQAVFVYEAFNINRTPEGGKPTFEFDGWLLTQTFNE